MNVDALRALYTASAAEHAAQIVDAAEGLVTAANTANRLVREMAASEVPDASA